MDKAERKAFFRWLDSESDGGLQRKLLALDSILFRLTEAAVLAEYNWMKKEILLELKARDEIK